MATIRNGRISTMFKYKKVKAIPELGLPALVRTYSDGVLSDTSSTSSESDKINPAEPCFITKEHSYTLKMAHFVNALQRDAVQKGDVERFLKRLGIVESGFELNSASNIAPLTIPLHHTLDTFGFFTITGSKATLQAMIAEVDKENKKWQEMASQRVQYIRTFSLDSPPFSDAEYEMVVMNPHDFLQEGAALTFSFDKENVEEGRGFKMYVAAPDGALRAGRQITDQLLPAFAGPKARAPEDALNPFLVILNAEIAFRRFQRRPHTLCDEYTELINLTFNLVEKIYFQPLVAEIELEEIREAELHVENLSNPISTRKDAAKYSRTGRVVERPGPGAPHDKIVEYRQYLMSGRDCELTEDDEDLLAELDARYNGAEGDSNRGGVSVSKVVLG